MGADGRQSTNEALVRERLAAFNLTLVRSHGPGGTMGKDDQTLVYPTDDANLAKESGSDHLSPGTVAGDYVVGGLIAEGGCGAVYHARHQTTARPVALKVLHASLSSQPKMVE